MQIFKCPGCGSEVQVKDIFFAEDSFPTDSTYSIKIETNIRHVEPITNSSCAELFKAFAKEQKNILAKFTRSVMRSDP